MKMTSDRRFPRHLAKTYREIYLMAGIHPLFIHKTDETSMKHIQKIATENPKCIAIGEIGLDYYGKNVNREKQKTVFREQLELAKGLGLSVSIHLRRATFVGPSPIFWKLFATIPG